MKTFFVILTLLILASCDGGSSGGSNASKKTDPVVEGPELSKDEMALKDRLVNRGLYDQRELAKELANTKGISEETLTKLDAYIEVECTIGGGCSIYSKE